MHCHLSNVNGSCTRTGVLESRVAISSKSIGSLFSILFLTISKKQSAFGILPRLRKYQQIASVMARTTPHRSRWLVVRLAHSRAMSFLMRHGIDFLLARWKRKYERMHSVRKLKQETLVCSKRGGIMAISTS